MDFGCDTPRIGGGEYNRDDEGDPLTKDKQFGYFENLPRKCAERDIEEGQQTDTDYRHRTKHQGGAQAQRGCRNRYGTKQQERERVVQPASQEKQKAQLKQIENNHSHVLAFREALVLGEYKTCHQVEDYRNANDEVAPAKLNLQTKHEGSNGNRHKLSCNRNPAQQDHGPKPDPVCSFALPDGADRGLRHLGVSFKCGLQ